MPFSGPESSERSSRQEISSAEYMVMAAFCLLISLMTVDAIYYEAEHMRPLIEAVADFRNRLEQGFFKPAAPVATTVPPAKPFKGGAGGAFAPLSQAPQGLSNQFVFRFDGNDLQLSREGVASGLDTSLVLPDIRLDDPVQFTAEEKAFLRGFEDRFQEATLFTPDEDEEEGLGLSEQHTPSVWNAALRSSPLRVTDDASLRAYLWSCLLVELKAATWLSAADRQKLKRLRVRQIQAARYRNPFDSLDTDDLIIQFGNEPSPGAEYGWGIEEDLDRLDPFQFPEFDSSDHDFDWMRR